MLIMAGAREIGFHANAFPSNQGIYNVYGYKQDQVFKFSIGPFGESEFEVRYKGKVFYYHRHAPKHELN